MPEWEITATTVHCDTVDDEVTILVARDAPSACTYRTRHASRTGRGKGRRGSCQDGDCALITEAITRFSP